MRIRRIRTAMAVALCACAFTCDGLTEPEDGVSGNWSVTYSDDNTACGEGVIEGQATLTIVQTGNTLTVTAEGIVFTGTLSGTTGTWSGSYPEDNGVTTEEFTVEFSLGGTQDTFEGGSTWTWTGVGSCSGTSTIMGTRG